MKSRMKRFQAISLALLVLLNFVFTAAQESVPKVRKVYIDYGLESEMRIPSKIMRETFRRRIPPGWGVREIRTNRLIFNEAGGIMFDAVGQPCAGLANARLRLSYNRRQPDGRRLTLHTGSQAYTVDGILDRDLQPIAEFADDSVPILTNLQYPDAATRKSCPVPSSRLRLVTLHPAFLDTHLGGLLTSMDSIPWSFSEKRRWDSRAPLPVATMSLADSLASALNEDRSAYMEQRAQVRSRIINVGESILKELTAKERELYVSILEANRRNTFNWEAYEAEVLADPRIDRAAWG